MVIERILVVDYYLDLPCILAFPQNLVCLRHLKQAGGIADLALFFQGSLYIVVFVDLDYFLELLCDRNHNVAQAESRAT